MPHQLCPLPRETRDGLHFPILKMGMKHRVPPGLGGTGPRAAHVCPGLAQGHRRKALGPSEPQNPDSQRPTPTLPPVRARGHRETGSRDREFRPRRAPRLAPRGSPGGRVFPPRCPVPRGARRCWKSRPSRRRGARPESPRGSSPGGRPRARPRSAAAYPRRPAPQAAPPSAAAAPPRRRPGRGRTTTPSWRRWPWPAADPRAREVRRPGVCSRDPRRGHVTPDGGRGGPARAGPSGRCGLGARRGVRAGQASAASKVRKTGSPRAWWGRIPLEGLQSVGINHDLADGKRTRSPH